MSSVADMRRRTLWPARPGIACLFAFAAAVSFGAGALDDLEEEWIFAVGEPDGKCGEFALAGEPERVAEKFGAGPVVFDAERDSPAEKWPAVHPGACDGWAGRMRREFVLRFQLQDEPCGLYKLLVGLADAHVWFPPKLRIKIGSRSVDAPLAAGANERPMPGGKAGKPQCLELELPAGVFAAGTNEISFTCVYGGWIAYDYLALLHYPDFEAQPQITDVTVRPTPFRRSNPETILDGELALGRELELVITAKNAFIPRFSVSVKSGDGAVSYEVPCEALPYKGVLRQQIGIPERDCDMDVKVDVAAAGAVRSQLVRVRPLRKWQIFVAPSAHTDIGYTALQPVCAAIHSQNLDDAIELLKIYPEFKWNAEVAWQLEDFLATRPPERAAELFRLAQDGTLGVQALHNNILTGLVSHEQACRLTAYAHELHRLHGVLYESAMIVDIPTVEAFMPMTLANAGIRYFSTASNLHRNEPFRALFSKSPCWWRGPDGSRVLMMFLEGYGHACRMAQGLDTARSEIIGWIERHESRPDYPCDAIYVQGLMFDNGSLNAAFAEVAHDWNAAYEQPRLILCRNAEFFRYVEQCCGDRLPEVSGSGGAYWEDGAASTARETAGVREARELLANADKFLALASFLSPQVEYPAAELKETWRLLMLADEHIWGSGASVNSPENENVKAQWEIKRGYMEGALAGAKELWSRAATVVARLARADGDSLLVINPLNWPRTDSVRCRLPDGYAMADGVESWIGADGEMCFLASSVPACGYRVYSLRKASPVLLQPQPVEGSSIESKFYKLVFDPQTGALLNVFDKELGRELKDTDSEFGMNDYLYVAGAGSFRGEAKSKDASELRISRLKSVKLQAYALGRLGAMMVVDGEAEMTPQFRAEITVWNDLKRVDFKNTFAKRNTYEKEAVYFAFPFKAAASPHFFYETANAIICANTGMLPGGCVEWFAIQHFARINAEDMQISWATPDAPMVCFNDIFRFKWRLLPERSFNNGHIFAYVMNNYWDTNYRAGQDGSFTFRFSFTSGQNATNCTDSVRFGWEVSNPLYAVVAAANPNGLLDENSASLAAIDSPNVVLIGGKKPETGDGLILRFWETAGAETDLEVRLPLAVDGVAESCDLMETPLKKLEMRQGALKMRIPPSGLATVRLLK